ncbi:hypothetical protein EVAR_80757_1 [Eumeta japonica]|uniref:Uncharacterized protein n=1 Tax=Eumeta variegata TaxID=151549 RepID=A0A4C1X8R0_EUMVA|nr:hypothetical protein EVAR_80757_1 [Eumeta japonica]
MANMSSRWFVHLADRLFDIAQTRPPSYLSEKFTWSSSSRSIRLITPVYRIAAFRGSFKVKTVIQPGDDPHPASAKALRSKPLHPIRLDYARLPKLCNNTAVGYTPRPALGASAGRWTSSAYSTTRCDDVNNLLQRSQTLGRGTLHLHIESHATGTQPAGRTSSARCIC